MEHHWPANLVSKHVCKQIINWHKSSHLTATFGWKKIESIVTQWLWRSSDSKYSNKWRTWTLRDLIRSSRDILRSVFSHPWKQYKAEEHEGRRQRESLRTKTEMIRKKLNVLTPKACTVLYCNCLCEYACSVSVQAWQYACVCADCMFYLPSVHFFPGQHGTSLIPQLWGNLWGSQTGWQYQSPGMSWQPRTWELVQRTPACSAWRRQQSLGHFSIQQEAHISCLTLQMRQEKTIPFE